MIRKTPKQKKIISLLLIIIVEMAINLAKLWFYSLKKVFVYIGETSKANSLTLWQLAVTPVFSKKTRSRATEFEPGQMLYLLQEKLLYLQMPPQTFKKLVYVLVTSVSMIKMSKKAISKDREEFQLQWVPHIY